MSQHDPLISVRQMLDHSKEAVEMVSGHSQKDLHENRMLNLALVRLMEIIGEASGRVHKDFHNLHPGVPWQRAADLHNRPAHGYDTVDFDILWTILQDDLPSLIKQLKQILQKSS